MIEVVLEVTEENFVDVVNRWLSTLKCKDRRFYKRILERDKEGAKLKKSMIGKKVSFMEQPKEEVQCPQ